MSNPAIRCPDCMGILRHSFTDDADMLPVYQCGTVGVETVRTMGRDTALVHTLDHSDRFFKRIDGTLTRVRPVRMGSKTSRKLLEERGYPFERDETTGKTIIPDCWTTALA